MYPSQFSFVRTIDDTKFETLLLQHPDRALVRSFVHGFRSEGFEPEHDGSVASGDDPATLTFPRLEGHRSFIQTTIDDEVAKGWLSPGTAFPIPGATYSPVFVVESANHRMRVVADHTRSGLNDGISRAACPTVYDSIIDFIRPLRWHRFATSLLSANSVLWKLDVSSAFKVLVMSPGVGRGVSFASRPLPGPRVHTAHPLADDIAFSDELVARALEPRTRSDYQRSLRQWIAYVMGQRDMGYAIDCYPTVSTLRAFIAHRYRLVTAVHQTLSGLAHWFGPLMGSEWEEVRSNRLVRAAIVGGQKLWRHAPVRAKPLPFDVLSTTLRRARSDPLLDYDRLCFLAMLALGFGACARSGELTLPDTIRFRDADKLPSCDSVVVSKTGFRVRLPYHKADRRWRGSFLQVVTSATSPHFMDVLSLFLAARDFRFRTMGVGAKLFLTSSGVPPTQNWFITRLHAEFGCEYSGHSLRSGGATHYAILGFLPAEIQRIGRWKSAAWEEYVRISPDLNMALLARR